MQPRITKKDRSWWTNKHHNFRQPIDRLYDVWNPKISGPAEQVPALRATVAGLQGIIADAIAEGARLRAIGSGWSISNVAVTDGWIVNTKPLNWMFRLSDRSVDPSYAGDRDGLMFAQCGTSIAELNENLASKGRSLRTQGASNGQTVVGAFSTGSHGSAIDESGVENFVVGLHVIVGPDRHVWLEQASYPVAAEHFADRLGAELVRDDDLFKAALVSFGSFGIVHGVMIETVPLFLLEAHRLRRPFDAGLRRTLDRLEMDDLALPHGAERPHHLDVVVNPYDIDEGVFVTVMYKRPYRDDYPRLEPGPWGHRPGDDFLHVVGTLSDELPALIPPLVTAVMNDRYAPFERARVGTLGEIFSYNTIHGRSSTGSALAVPLDRANEALDLVLDINLGDDGAFAGVYGIRFVQQTAAMLGFTRFDPSCVIDLDGVHSRRTRTFYERVWGAMEDAGIPYALHWGKAGGFTPEHLERAYGPSLETWVQQRHVLMSAPARAAFSSPFLESSGLAG